MMGTSTTIEWCDATFNAWEGCEKVSPGCANCYAEAQNHRWGKDNWGTGKPRRHTSAANWRKPVAWDKAAAAGLFVRCDKCGKASVGRRATVTGLLLCGEAACRSVAVEPIARPKVFCLSIGDWLDDAVPVEWLGDLLEVVYATPHLDWLLLTKRPENWLARMEAVVEFAASRLTDEQADLCPPPWALAVQGWYLDDEPPENVWIGTTVEDQRRADERIPRLLDIPAKVHFLSCEPLLESVDFHPQDDDGGRETTSWLDYGCTEDRIDWVIVGGESGPGARPFDLAWARSVVQQCQAACVPVFVKQLGSHAVSATKADHTGRLAVAPTGAAPIAPVPWRLWLEDRKGGDMESWPDDMRVRRFPKAVPS